MEAQAELVSRHDELLAANNTVARKEQASKGGTFKIMRPHMVPAELDAIERITDVREKVHAIRQQKAAWRDDKACRTTCRAIPSIKTMSRR